MIFLKIIILILMLLVFTFFYSKLENKLNKINDEKREKIINDTKNYVWSIFLCIFFVVCLAAVISVFILFYYGTAMIIRNNWNDFLIGILCYIGIVIIFFMWSFINKLIS